MVMLNNVNDPLVEMLGVSYRTISSFKELKHSVKQELDDESPSKKLRSNGETTTSAAREKIVRHDIPNISANRSLILLNGITTRWFSDSTNLVTGNIRDFSTEEESRRVGIFILCNKRFLIHW
ncbi:unnamed protein product [Didymodactylos carnosus]|uniref:Uncharacterized protein n=1 Tax=Didymodactylos carnosus TaxID=1234261 RepID=A0A814ZDV3_9BILA|nr:unnamed protein product [Didymodactylos carnosus]CAF1306568.1 unnamed protein product [Didymodactylos carnosus]CAF4004088.1 unnamed protein product [Didymodactylos carnosus]CAF4113693.1 unnamed protein product [Didymodactylos carnosus]